MAPPRKPSAQRGRKDRKFDVVDLSVVQPATSTPDLPDAERMLPSTVEAWQELWTAALASAIVIPASDMAALARLFHMRDEYERLMEGFRSERIVSGSQGQPVLNPVFQAANALAKEIRAMEDRFALTPRARLNASIELGEAKKSLDDLNAAMAGPASDGPPPPDPRVIDVGAS